MGKLWGVASEERKDQARKVLSRTLNEKKEEPWLKRPRIKKAVFYMH